jgi:hypothetical protein
MTSITAVEEIINSCLFVVESSGTGPYVHDVKHGYNNLDTGYHFCIHYCLGARLNAHELLQLSQLSETPSPENCGCDVCWVERNDI